MTAEEKLKKIFCKNHDLVICIPEKDSEFIPLVTETLKLFDHLKNFPKCTFKEVLA